MDKVLEDAIKNGVIKELTRGHSQEYKNVSVVFRYKAANRTELLKYVFTSRNGEENARVKVFRSEGWSSFLELYDLDDVRVVSYVSSAESKQASAVIIFQQFVKKVLDIFNGVD